jgi:alpha-L-rhamnosidase
VTGFPGSSTAQWIWTTDNLNDNQAYFRWVVGTPPAATGSVLVTGDNVVSLYVNGTLETTSANWQQVSEVITALNPGDVVAAHVTDSGGLAGFLAEISWDGTTTGTDASWRVASSAPTGWEQPGFDDTAWVPATTYGTYGVAPWSTNVTGFPGSSTAQWIWTTDNLNDNQAYFRWVVGT